MAEFVGSKQVDVLINNAGVFVPQSLEELDCDAVRRQFEVNILGPQRVTRALLSNLTIGSKVAIVTSRLGCLADNTTGGVYGYRLSKAGANMVGVNLARDLKSRGIAVILLHPGYVRTAMTGNEGLTDPTTAGRQMIARIDELSLDTSGAFMHADGRELPW